MPKSPTQAQAKAALKTITDLLVGFPFVDDSSLSVAVSGIITPLIRHACRAVPLHVITAPKMASGKTLLATLPSYVMNVRPIKMSQAENQTGERKRLLAVLLEGGTVVVLDNVERELRSDALCTITTEPYYSDRLLGSSRYATVPSRATFYATGNNLVVAGDLSTRCVVCSLDPHCEQPEKRTFDVNLHEEVPRRRAELAVAALTIVRAYLEHGTPKLNVPNFARFEEWCKFVRHPLIWLGMVDPCAGRDRIEANDPVREQLRVLLTVCHEVFGSKCFKVKELVDEATRDAKPEDFEAREALREILADLSGRGPISPTSVGKFIGRYANRIEGGLRFEKVGTSKHAALLRVVSKGELGEVGEAVSKVKELACGSDPDVSYTKSGRTKIIKKGNGSPAQASANGNHCNGHDPSAAASAANPLQVPGSSAGAGAIYAGPTASTAVTTNGSGIDPAADL